MSYTNPLEKNPLDGYTTAEMLDIWERSANEITQWIEPRVVRGWIDTIVKANFILAYSLLNTIESGKLK